MYFNNEAAINWLVANDNQFLKDVLSMNETYAKLCGDDTKVPRQ